MVRLKKMRDLLGLVGLEVSSQVQVHKQKAYVFNVAKWKRRHLKSFFPEYALLYRPLNTKVYHLMGGNAPPKGTCFIVWGLSEPEDLQKYCDEFGVHIYRIEDGFFRSIGLGSEHVLPLSICFDKLGIYFDSTGPSDLERIIQTHPFDQQPKLMDEARHNLRRIQELGLSKYNNSEYCDVSVLYGEKKGRRVLVLGQVEDDASLIFGCNEIMTNEQLVRRVQEEEPEAQIIFKNHPDIIAGTRKELSSLENIGKYAQVVNINLSLKDSLLGVDQVYTQTSLGGFEALMHGVNVTCYGAPFYSGWGLTDDRQKVERRTRKVSLSELFAAAYMVYPRYQRMRLLGESSLTPVIDHVAELKREHDLLGAREIEPYGRLSNLATGAKVDSKYVRKAVGGRIVVVTDNQEGIKKAIDFAHSGKQVLIVFPSDAVANELSRNTLIDLDDHINMGSIHKLFGVAFSKVEARTVELSNTFAQAYRKVLSSLTSGMPKILDNEAWLDAMALSLSDYVYNECLRAEGLRDLLSDTNASLVLLIKNFEAHRDVCLMTTYYADILHAQSRVFLELDLKVQMSSDSEVYLPSAGFNSSSNVKHVFHSVWWDIHASDKDEYRHLHEPVLVCGNILKDNYAYAPASKKIVDFYSNNQQTVLLFNSATVNKHVKDSMRDISLFESNWSNVAVYQGEAAHYKSKYPEVLNERIGAVGTYIEHEVFQLLSLVLPQRFLAVMSHRLSTFFSKVPANLLFSIEVSKLMGRARLFATSMDRAPQSRVMSAIARASGVPSIGVQPQIISASTRYQKSSVDRIGVLDTAQVMVFNQLAAGQESKSYPIGSVNLFERLKQLQENTIIQRGIKHIHKTIFFVMQHSNAASMIRMANALNDICQKHDFHLVVKPHPHQEVAVYNKIKKIFANLTNCKILTPQSDTYRYLPQVDIVVGLFSSVLLEAAVFGQDVVVASFGNLDESIDFSASGLALGADTNEELEAVLIDLVESGPRSQALAVTRSAYLARNPQFNRPYSLDVMDGFLASGLRLPKTQELL